MLSDIVFDEMMSCDLILLIIGKLTGELSGLSSWYETEQLELSERVSKSQASLGLPRMTRLNSKGRMSGYLFIILKSLWML